MKVLFLATYFPRPANRRMGTWSLDHATALRDYGVDLEVISLTPAIPGFAKRVIGSAATYTDCPARAALNGISVLYPRWRCYPIKQMWPLIAKSPLFFLTAGWKSIRRQLVEDVRRINPDVILANHSLVNGFVAMQLRRELGTPYITVDHEVGDFINCTSNPRWLKVLSPVVESAATSVTVSNGMLREAQRILPKGRFQTIYNGAGFDPCKASALDRHTSRDEMVIFCCGNLYGRKDVPLLVKAFGKLAAKHPQAMLRIAGSGPERDSIDRLIETMPNRDQIAMLGSIEHEAVQSEMLAADIFALVGWAEPFGVVFLEAMANGCPVVVSSDAGVAEILTDRETAMLTRPRDESSVVKALDQLLSDAALRKHVASSGHALYSGSCRWSHRAAEYLDVMQRAIDSYSHTADSVSS